MNIRRFTDRDARRVSHLIRRTLVVSNGPDYRPEVIESFVRHFTPGTLRRLSRERDMFVVEEGKRLVATGSLSGDAIVTFFVNPRYQHRGIGSALLAHVERLAARKGVTRLHLRSSFTALRFYEDRGYVRAADQTEPDAPYVQMAKDLPSP